MNWHELTPDTQAAIIMLVMSGMGFWVYLFRRSIQRAWQWRQAKRNGAYAHLPAVRYRGNTWRQS